MSTILSNLINFKPQEGVEYKHAYQDILKSEKVMADAKKYESQSHENHFSHLDNYYLATIRNLILTDTFFLFYFVRSNTKNIRHDFAVQMCANTDHDFELYKNNQEARFLEERARGHLKTKNNEDLAVQCVLTYPEECLLFVAFRSASSERSMESVKNLLEMEEVKHAFTDILYENPKKDTTWSLAKGLLVKRKLVSKDLTVQSCGFYEGSNTGGHYRFLFLDDIMTKDMKDSPKMIQLGKEHFDNIGNLSDFGNQDCQTMVRVTGTPYAWDDVISYVDSKVYPDHTKMYKTRKIREADDEDVPIFVTPAEHEINKTSDNYRSQQQLDPSPSKTESLNWDDIVITDFIPDDLLHFIVVDPAGSISEFDNADRDNWAILHIGVQYGRDMQGLYNLYIIDAIIRNMTETEAPQQIANMYHNNRMVQAIAIEQSYQGYLATLVCNQIKQSTGVVFTDKDNSLIRLHPQSRTISNKKDNIYKQLKYMMDNKKIFLHDKIPNDYILNFKKEVMSFPTGKRDDALDCLSYKEIILDKLNYDYRNTQYMRRKTSNKIAYMEEIRNSRVGRGFKRDQQYMFT